MRRRAHRGAGWLPWAATIALLAGLAFDRIVFQAPSADSTAYHARIRSVAEKLPDLHDRWLGTDVEVAAGAITLLKPNVIISRSYAEIDTGRHVNLLLVQCRDARDLDGHFPPNCYKGRGCILETGDPTDWNVDGLKITGMQYVFLTPQHTRMTVENFMLLPSGKTARDLDAVEQAAKDRRQKYFGAAQVQFVFDQPLSQSDRDEIVGTFVEMLRPLLNEILQKGNDGKMHL
jgi:hypothetical protein